MSGCAQVTLSEDQIYLMVQAMEAWFYGDKDALREYYGQGFRIAGLSQRLDVEAIPKADLFAGLQRATKDCQRGEYAKGEHSFQILARSDPELCLSSSAKSAMYISIRFLLISAARPIRQASPLGSRSSAAA